jgi:ribosomal protein S18 acetylase RimI-like enzyme
MSTPEAMVRAKLDADVDGIAAVAESLPEWFTESARQRIPVDARFQCGFVAERDGRVVGFILYLVWEATAHITWVGVHPKHQRQGTGRRLVQETEAVLKRGGVARLEVATLSDSVDYEPYERTRAFYEAVGFGPFRRVQHDNPECPESLHLCKDI